MLLTFARAEFIASTYQMGAKTMLVALEVVGELGNMLKYSLYQQIVFEFDGKHFCFCEANFSSAIIFRKNVS